MNFREITLTDWELSGAGATANSYFNRLDESLMLKLFTGAITDSNYVKKEFALSKNVEQCQIKTAKAIEIVKCGEKLGIIYERLQGKKSFSRLCSDDDKNLETYAREFAKETKILHNTRCIDGFDSRAKQLQKIYDAKDFSSLVNRKIKAFLDKYPDSNTCLHGDLQSGNLVKADGQNYWIDLGGFSYGNPILDLACMYFFYGFLPGKFFARKMVHMNIGQLKRFWISFLDEYLADYDSASKAKYIKEIKNCLLIYVIYTADNEDYKGFSKALLHLGINIVALFTSI